MIAILILFVLSVICAGVIGFGIGDENIECLYAIGPFIFSSILLVCFCIVMWNNQKDNKLNCIESHIKETAETRVDNKVTKYEIVLDDGTTFEVKVKNKE